MGLCLQGVELLRVLVSGHVNWTGLIWSGVPNQRPSAAMRKRVTGHRSAQRKRAAEPEDHWWEDNTRGADRHFLGLHHRKDFGSMSVTLDHFRPAHTELNWTKLIEAAHCAQFSRRGGCSEGSFERRIWQVISDAFYLNLSKWGIITQTVFEDQLIRVIQWYLVLILTQLITLRKCSINSKISDSPHSPFLLRGLKWFYWVNFRPKLFWNW